MGGFAAISNRAQGQDLKIMMDQRGRLTRFADFPEKPEIDFSLSEEKAVGHLRHLILKSVKNRVSWQRPTGSLLSGGIDSSVVAHIANQVMRQNVGQWMTL